jgi:hypothetical protein
LIQNLPPTIKLGDIEKALKPHLDALVGTNTTRQIQAAGIPNEKNAWDLKLPLSGVWGNTVPARSSYGDAREETLESLGLYPNGSLLLVEQRV